jgi:hypothetical protein
MQFMYADVTENLKGRNPADAGGLHRDRTDAAAFRR